MFTLRMVAKRKAGTKEDLESKITELEEKLSKLAEQLEASAPKPAKGTLPKGF